MAKTYSITVKVSPDVAYNYVADVLKHPEWSPDSMQLTAQKPGPQVVGSRYQSVGNLVGKPNSSQVEIATMEAPRRFAFRATDSNSVWLNEFTFTPVNGGTRIDRRMTVERGPAMLKVLLPILDPFVIRPGHAKSLGMLRDRLENPPAAV